MKTRKEQIEEVTNRVLIEILFKEKKNYNATPKEQKDTKDMIKDIKATIEREVKRNDIQKNESSQF